MELCRASYFYTEGGWCLERGAGGGGDGRHDSTFKKLFDSHMNMQRMEKNGLCPGK